MAPVSLLWLLLATGLLLLALAGAEVDGLLPAAVVALVLSVAMVAVVGVEFLLDLEKKHTFELSISKLEMNVLPMMGATTTSFSCMIRPERLPVFSTCSAMLMPCLLRPRPSPSL